MHDEDIPHWIVIRGWNQQGVFVNDPVWIVPRLVTIPFATFTRRNGYGSGQVLIEVLRKN